MTEVFGFASGLFAYTRQRLIDLRLGMNLLLVTIPMALLGTWAAGQVEPDILKTILGIGLFVVGLSFLRSPEPLDIKRSDNLIEQDYGGEKAETCLVAADEERICYSVCNRTLGRIIAGIGGLFVGMISTGLGELNGYFLLQRCRVPSRVSVATSVFVVAVTVLCAAGGHVVRFAQSGGDTLNVVFSVVIFTIPGVIIGGQLRSLVVISRTSQQTMERGLGMLFLFVAHSGRINPVNISEPTMSTIVIDSNQAGFRPKEANMENINILAGDIGGTKTNLAVYNEHIGLDAPIAEATYPSKDYPSLEALVQEFLTQFQAEIHLASFGVAGPVANGQATITNLPWVMDEKELAQRLDFNSVHLLNDLLAFAHAVPFLEDKDVHVLNKGKPAAEGAKAVVAPGTGLGEAYLVWDGMAYRAFPSEGGHADFAPRTRLEAGLLRHLWNRFGHVSYERVCSGTGLGRIYAYLKENGFVQEKSWLANELARAHDPAPVIVQGALDDKAPCEICRKTLDVFISILGAEAGNMALRLLATGGVYLGGGISPRIISALGQESFMQAFQNKGRMSGILEDIPVGVIVNPKAALLGAACHGLNTRRRQSGHTT